MNLLRSGSSAFSSLFSGVGGMCTDRHDAFETTSFQAFEEHFPDQHEEAPNHDRLTPTQCETESDSDESENDIKPRKLTPEYFEEQAKEREKMLEQLNVQLRQVEIQLVEANENLVIYRPFNMPECHQLAEEVSKQIFDISAGARHINIAGEQFELEEMLQKVRTIRNEFPATPELKSTYEVLESELSHVNGRRLEKKTELLGELDAFLSLKRDVLKLEPVECILQQDAISNTADEILDEDPNAPPKPEFFEQSRVKASQCRRRLAALQKAQSENNRLEETTLHLSSTQASLVDLETYFSETREKLLADLDRLKKNKSQFKLQQAEKGKGIEEAKLKLRFERDDLIESIRTKKLQIEHDMKKLIFTTVSIREQEREEDNMHKVDHKVEELLADTQRLLAARVDDTQAGATISKIQQGIGENIKEDCAHRLQQRRQHVDECILQAQVEFYNICKSHWNKCVMKYHYAQEFLKDLKRQLIQETATLRKQKKQYSEGKHQDQNILRLQEALCQQRLRLVNDKQSELEYWKKELAQIDNNLNLSGTITCLSESPTYKSWVRADFRDEFRRYQKESEHLEWLENLKDLVASVCDIKEGLINTTKDEPSTEMLENLLDTLETAENKGRFPQLKQILQGKSETRNQLRLMHNIIKDAIENGSINATVLVYGRSLRSGLNNVKSKLGLLLASNSTPSTHSSSNGGGSTNLNTQTPNLVFDVEPAETCDNSNAGSNPSNNGEPKKQNKQHGQSNMVGIA